MKLTNKEIEQIETNLKLHVDYSGKCSNGLYLHNMDKLTIKYKGARGVALSSMLNDYYKQIGVDNLKQALKRLKAIETTV